MTEKKRKCSYFFNTTKFFDFSVSKNKYGEKKTLLSLIKSLQRFFSEKHVCLILML